MTIKSEAFARSVDNYLSIIDKPWTTLFYESAWSQIGSHLPDSNLDILDVGCGFGVTSLHFSKQGHRITGIDPTIEMLTIAEKRAKEQVQNIRYHHMPIEDLQEKLEPGQFDWILCHNVLEYVDQPGDGFKAFDNLLKPEGHLSLICHNPVAKVLKKAIMQKDPTLALESLSNYTEFVNTIQTEMTTYPFDSLEAWLTANHFEIIGHYGIQNIYFLIDDNHLKMNPEWHNNVTRLELTLGALKPYRDIAHWTHLIARKKH